MICFEKISASDILILCTIYHRAFLEYLLLLFEGNGSIYYQHFKPHSPHLEFSKTLYGLNVFKSNLNLILCYFTILVDGTRSQQGPINLDAVFCLSSQETAKTYSPWFERNPSSQLPACKTSPIVFSFSVPDSSSLLEKAETGSVSVRTRLCFGNKYLWLIPPKFTSHSYHMSIWCWLYLCSTLC